MLPMFLVMTAPLWGLLLFWLLPLGVALPLYVAVVVVGIGSHVLMARSARLPVATGAESLVGRSATVVAWSGSTGTVRCHSELWSAHAAGGDAPSPGDSVEVVAVDHLTLEVVPAAHVDPTRSSKASEPASSTSTAPAP